MQRILSIFLTTVAAVTVAGAIGCSSDHHHDDRHDDRDYHHYDEHDRDHDHDGPH